MHNTSRFTLSLLTAVLVVCFLAIPATFGQTLAKVEPERATASDPEMESMVPAVTPKGPASDAERISALEETLRQQATKLDELQKLLLEQQQTIKLLGSKLGGVELSGARDAVATGGTENRETGTSAIVSAAQTPQVDDRLKKVETRISEIGAVKFSGDIRLRSESFFGLTNSLASGANPALLGNDLTWRHRMRIRARLNVSGSIGKEFDWRLRFATGSFPDNISTNQTLTDFFTRKPFALDQAFVIYKPAQLPGLQLQAGKFEAPWTYRFNDTWPFPELVIDNDLTVEGFNQSYTYKLPEKPSGNSFLKSLRVKELKFTAWQLPLLERNSGFVRNADGTVNIQESGRNGRDLALYGGQVRARLEPSKKSALVFSVADLYFSGTQFISPVQVFGSQLQLPLTFTIPATATTPAQIITTQVSIPRELLVAGHGNLGLTNASNNATNRDGRLASGFNLVDVFGRIELNRTGRYPVAINLNFVTNTQTRDVVTIGPGGADRILPNHENNGFWAEVQVGELKKRGDRVFGYTFMRIEKDAVLTPFNMSDVTQQSDMRGHRFAFIVAAHQNAAFSIIGIVTERPNGLFGPFVPTPPGSLNRATTRLQIDTIIRF